MTLLDPYSNGPDPDDEEEGAVEISRDLASLWSAAILAQSPLAEPKKVVRKHLGGAHDQKTHGRWAGKSRVPNMAREAIKTTGGFSMRMGSGIVPHTGYMVARGNKTDEVDLGPVDDLKAADISRYIDHHRVDLSKPSRYLGGWVDERSHVILDISERTMDRAKAIRLARQRAQDAIFDLSTFEDIVTKALGRGGSGLPLRFWLDYHQPPEVLVEDIKRMAKEASP